MKELRAGGVIATQVFRKAAADLNGHWKLVSNDNWEAYLKALGDLFYLLFGENPTKIISSCFQSNIFSAHVFCFFIKYNILTKNCISSLSILDEIGMTTRKCILLNQL